MASEYLKWKYRDVLPEEKVELTPRQKRANWWYYYKWYVLLGVVMAATAIYLLARGLGFWEVKPDYQVAYVGQTVLPEDTAAGLEQALESLGQDCNGDGRVTVRLNQYVLADQGGDAMYAYAGSTKLMADLDACDSYFFLLENPEVFQQSYEVLRRLDGTLPEDGDHDVEDCCIPWTDCPTLRELALGEYEESLLGQQRSGDNQERLSGLFLARRGFWTEKSVNYVNQCDTLWDILTRGV